jgi:hypothetical protein
MILPCSASERLNAISLPQTDIRLPEPTYGSDTGNLSAGTYMSKQCFAKLVFFQKTISCRYSTTCTGIKTLPARRLLSMEQPEGTFTITTIGAGQRFSIKNRRCTSDTQSIQQLVRQGLSSCNILAQKRLAAITLPLQHGSLIASPN